tara:strand:- start:883 stop:1344 length:462 start_codon:yes stop_codon:yes gene_type:complete
MDITLKNVKIYAGLSEETIAFNASVYIDGKKVGDAKNNGHGGANDVDVRDKDGRWNRDLLQKMETEAATHTWSYESEEQNHDLDSYISELVGDVQEQRDLKRKCKTQTLFRIPDEVYQDDEYHVMKQKYDFTVRDYLIRKYGDKVEILNERIK